eukprot:scaffold2356_cov67-Skeletonema_dohrnii-CCMP3373.AAC.1
MLACFFIMCKNAFTPQFANAPVAGRMGPAPSPAGAKDTDIMDRFNFVREKRHNVVRAGAKDTERKKDIFYFVRKTKHNVALLGEFSMNQDSVALLPLNTAKQLLSGSSEHAFETIQAELEAIDDNVLI